MAAVEELKVLVQRMLQIQKTVGVLEKQVRTLKNLGGSSALGKKLVGEKIQALRNLVTLKEGYRNDLLKREVELDAENRELQYGIQHLTDHLRLCQLRDLPASPEESVETSETSFGKLKDGKEIHQLVMSNQTGMCVKLITYGGIITNIEVPDRYGKTADVVTGFPDLKGYLAKHPFFGALTGRYANRIAKGTFDLNGTSYKLEINNGPNALHGGSNGFDKRLWKFEKVSNDHGVGYALTYTAADMEEGYPGEMQLKVSYLLAPHCNSLTITYEAENTSTDKDTVLNLTNHSYFNLSGVFESKTLYEHQFQFNCDNYLPIDETSIPLGDPANVEGTPFDFRKEARLGSRIHSKEKQLTQVNGGFDHNMCINNEAGQEVDAVSVYEPSTGRAMTVQTDQPGVQFYTGNYLPGCAGKGGAKYDKHSGFALETQHYPDSPNKPAYPTTVLKKGEHFNSLTRFVFSTRE